MQCADLEHHTIACGTVPCALPSCVCAGQLVPAHSATVGHEEGEAKRNGESL